MKIDNPVHKRVLFAQKCSMLRPEIRFQNWKVGKYHMLHKDIPSFAWENNKQFLRYSIETPEVTEFICDIDSKNSKGEKSLKHAITEALKIYDKLKQEGFKPYFYYSGGSGIHIHTLINISSIHFLEHNKLNIDLNQYEKEFRAKSGEILNLIDERNQERSRLKRWIADYFQITSKIDNMLFSTKEMITCEGYQKRDSKTGYNKILIPIENIHGGEREEEILKFIDEKKFRYILDLKYHHDFSYPKQDLLKYLNEQYEASKTKIRQELELIRGDFISSDRYKSQQNNVKASQRIIYQHLITFSKIYQEKNINSTNKYYEIVVRYLYVNTYDISKTIEYFREFFEVFKCPNNLKIPIESKVKSVVNAMEKYPIKIIFSIHNKYLTKQDFYREYNTLFKSGGVM